MGLFTKKNNITYEILTDRYIDSDGKEWVSQYHYDEIDIQTTPFRKKNYCVNQPVKLLVSKISNNMSEIDSIKVMIDDILLGYISTVGQRRMIRDYSHTEERLVLAQISVISFSKVSIRIVYYKSKIELERQAAQYEKEKSSYERMPPKTVRDLANISYVAVRGKDEEEGAVQRVLNRQRISSIKNYVLNDNMFVNTFVLNWTNVDSLPSITDEYIDIPIAFASAQLIDGQHRLEGLKLAIREKQEIAERNIIVSMAINLETVDAAKIFLNINSEQKPVPRSLIYDLYGVTAEDRNFAVNRATDIAEMLNQNVDSPFYNVIKYPGAPRGKGKLDLSTVVNALKAHVDHGGKFEECNISNLVLQANILQNYFKALRFHADKTAKWSTINQNIFFKAAGFIGAIEFFVDYVLPKCVAERSFKEEIIVKLFDFESVELITPKDIETTDGRTARKRVMDNLKDAFLSDIPGESDYEI